MGKLHSTAAWQRRRAYQLSIEPLCRMCASIGRVTPATVADHIDRHGNDPELFASGALQSLCARHHNSEKQRYEKSGDTTIRGCDLRGRPLDPAHPWNKR